MNSRFNSRLVNRGPSQGNVAAYYDRFQNLVNVNDGTRSFVLKTVDCHDQAAPFTDVQETRVAITHSDHDISQISDGFLTFNVTVYVQLTGIDSTKFNDSNNLCKIFVGWKSSNQIIDQLQVLCNNLSTDYQQNECVREGFAYSTIKPKVEKKTKKYVHSLYENVSYYSPSVCGAYVNLDELKDGGVHPVDFEVNLPFDDILCLQAFDMFPNAVVGDLELKFYVKPKGLVWCLVDPNNVKDSKEFFQGEDILESPNKNMSACYTHAFTQIGNPAEIITQYIRGDANEDGVTPITIDTGRCTLFCTQLKVNSLKSNMYGFNVVPSTLRHIADIFSRPQIIPAQQLDYNAFPISASSSGIQSTINMPVTNCSCISILFPKIDNCYTVFENPIYQNLQLTVNGKNMPDEVVDTTGARFLQQQLIASDLDGGLECTKEFEDSIIQAKNKNDQAATRYVNCLSDCTSFMWNVQCERGNSGYTFDGIDSNGQNIPIQIKGGPKYSGENSDTYYYFDVKDKTRHPPPPQIWLCRDTYWLASTQGLKYVSFGTPEGKVVRE